MSRIKEHLRSWARKNLLTLNTIRYRVELPRLLEAFEIIGQQESLFDGGAGAGQMLRLIQEKGYCKKMYALEYDAELYSILLRNISKIPNCEAKLGSLLDIPYPDESMDCVMTTQVLEHIEDHETAASELGRILKVGGHIIVSVPHPPEPFHTPGHVREGYSCEDLQCLFPPESFELIYTGYSLTRKTVNRALAARRLPFGGTFIPVAWADRELKLTNEERKKDFPYGITCLFKKS
jgi:SAM-dependent methyltransferase